MGMTPREWAAAYDVMTRLSMSLPNGLLDIPDTLADGEFTAMCRDVGMIGEE